MRLLLALFALAIVVAGCGDDEGSAATSPSFEGIPWLLVSGIDAPGWEKVAPSANFEGGTVTGFNGCNQFTAPYTAHGDKLKIGLAASTMMACAPPGDAIEQAYNAALGKVAKWSVENDQLVLRSADGNDLLTYRTATVIGAWDATSVHRGDSIQSVIIGTKITATFAEDRKLSGSAGCNTYNAAFTLNQGSIKIEQPISTRMACSEPEGVGEQEHDYLAALPTAASYRIEGSQMTLLTAAGTIVATYDRAP